MDQVIIGKLERQLPSSFSELTKAQANTIGPILFNPGITDDERKVSILFHLLDVKESIFKRIPHEDIYGMYSLIQFLFTEPESKCLIESFVLDGETFLCPAPSMEYSSYIEFAMASSLLENIPEGNTDLNEFNEIIATLCRPLRRDGIDEHHPEFNGDLREKYNAYLISKRADLFKDLEPWKKISVIRFFTAFQKEIRKSDNYALIFNTPKIKKDGKEITPDQPVQSNDIVPGWIGYLYEVAGGKFGTFDQTAHTNVHTVLIHICREINKSKR